MIDYHCHILPGLDDGPSTPGESLSMARQLLDGGITEVYCTPHCISGTYENTPDLVREKTAELQTLLERSGIHLQVHPGMEYLLDESFPGYSENLLTLGETNLVLVEAHPRSRWETVLAGVSCICQRGLVPLMAHPERYPWLTPGMKENNGLRVHLKAIVARFIPRPTSHEALTLLLQQGVKFQGNLGAFSGFYGREVQDRAEFLQNSGVYDVFGSDAHNPDRMPIILKKFIEI